MPVGRRRRRAAAEPVPRRAVDVADRLGRIDEAVPQFVERLDQPAFHVGQTIVRMRRGGFGFILRAGVADGLHDLCARPQADRKIRADLGEG